MAAALISGNCCGGVRKPRGELRRATIAVGILEIAPGLAAARREMARRSHGAPSTPPVLRLLYPAPRASISSSVGHRPVCFFEKASRASTVISNTPPTPGRSEEHTSELQSLAFLV